MKTSHSIARVFSIFCFATLALFSLAALHYGSAVAQSSQTMLAATPPMGWNSWDAYGEAVTEKDLRDSAKFMADNLKSYGWQYVVVDSGWYVTNHSVGFNKDKAEFSLDEYGRFIPAVNTFSFAKDGAGFKPFADYVHSLGLKFGFHVIRGIPREAVKRNTPILGTSFHAADAADTNDVCPWNSFNYGLKEGPAAQAYYDSIAKLYAQWDVDFIKIDCISARPYKEDEIRMFREALDKTGRPIVLSLSPGAAPLDKADKLAKYSHMWRISDDVWDVWKGEKAFPQGPANQFVTAAKWASYSGPGHWPDADMLPIGTLKPSPGWGKPRESQLTPDEQRSLVTLWTIFRSPLIMGGNLLALKNDPATLALLTNPEVIAVDQHSKNSRAVVTTDTASVWVSEPESGGGYNVAVFNLDGKPQTLTYTLQELGLPAGSLKARDLWLKKDLGSLSKVEVKLAPHASVLYQLSQP